jgi:TetR/AcrR family transcriptional regulator, transcriptional repressor for nem operon
MLSGGQEDVVVSVADTRDTRTAILDAAEDILQRRSFNSFSYSHISETLGLRKASLHYHFPSKLDLGMALLARYRSRFRQWCHEMEASGRGPCELLEAYIAGYEACLVRSQVCAGGVLGVEYNTIDGPMQEALQAFYDDHTLWLRALLEWGRREGVLAFSGSAEALAALFSATVQGALQQARTCGGHRFRQAVDQLLRLVVVSGPNA